MRSREEDICVIIRVLGLILLRSEMRLREQLKGIIPEDDLARLSNRFHVVGDIAIISVHPEMEIYKVDIAETIVSRHRNIRTVLNKLSRLEGDRRVAGFEVLTGNETVTVHREFGFCYRLDLRKVFFNSHLGYERRRVALKVKPGESARSLLWGRSLCGARSCHRC
jgi:tRNA (guanine37-N1)-methyltransferase